MKTRLLLIALLLSSVANAQVDESEKVWTFLLIISGNDQDPDGGRGFLENTGISDAGAEALVQYARHGRDDVNRMGMANAQALCKGKEALRDREALARRIEADQAQERALWKGLDQNLVVVLSPEDEAKIRNWIDQEFNVGFGPHIDVANEIRSGRLDPDQLLARACQGLDEAANRPAVAETKDQAEVKRPPQAPAPSRTDVQKQPRSVSSAASAVARPTGPPPSLIALPKPPAYSQCDAWAINNLGVIVGYCSNSDPTAGVPVRWDHGVLEVLNGPLRPTGSAKSDDGLPVEAGMAVGINDAGEIVASLIVGTSANVTSRAAIWEHGSWRDLGFRAGSRSSAARGINSNGDVIGTSGARATVFWRNKDIEVLPPLIEASNCIGLAINTRGQAVGACTDADSGKTSAVMWHNQAVVELANPCVAGEHFATYARAISDSGMIGGMAGNCALIWHASTPDQGRVLAEQGVVNSINKRGELGGSLGNYGAPRPLAPRGRPAKWASKETAGLELEIPAGANGMVRAINDQGKFVGVVYPSTGGSYAFVSQ